MTNLNVNGANSQVNNNPELKNIKEVQIEETPSVFNEENIDENLLDVLLTGIIDGFFGDGNFTKEEADIFVAGEIEIEKMAKEIQNNKSLLETVFDPDSAEQEAREKYLAEHPEYAEVMKEGLKVKSDYDKAYETTRNKWIEENPSPEMLEEGGLLGVKVTTEYKEWQQKQTEFMNSFKKEYISQNPDYANLKAAEDKNKNFLEKLLGF